MNKDDTCWGLEGDEILHAEIDDRIEMYVDDFGEEIPETMTFLEYRRVTVPPFDRRDAECVIDRVWEDLDENYGSPDGPFSEPTEEVYRLAKDFLDEVHAAYIPWQCEPTGRTETVNLHKWIHEHRPDLIPIIGAVSSDSDSAVDADAPTTKIPATDAEGGK